MKTKTIRDYIPEAIRYLCLAVVFVLGLLSIMATGGGDGSSGSSSGNTLISEANVTVYITLTSTGIPGALVEGRFLDKDTNVTEVSTCRTDANGRCVVAVAIPGQLADEVTLNVSQTDFYTNTDTKPLDSSGSVNVLVRLTPK